MESISRSIIAFELERYTIAQQGWDKVWEKIEHKVEEKKTAVARKPYQAQRTKGIYYNGHKKKWIVRRNFRGKQYFGGNYDTEEEALKGLELLKLKLNYEIQYE
jgi:hypothetical protein